MKGKRNSCYHLCQEVENKNKVWALQEGTALFTWEEAELGFAGGERRGVEGNGKEEGKKSYTLSFDD